LLLRFAGVGAGATAVHYLVFVALVQGGVLGAAVASAAGFAAGAVVNYVLSASLVFTRTRSHGAAVWRFMTVAAVGFALNSVVMAVATIALGVHFAVAQVSASGAVLLWTFTGNCRWTFADDP
jgi:putative flippase GtrA